MITGKDLSCIDQRLYGPFRQAPIEEARAVALGLYLDERLEATEQKELKQHLDQCSSCANLLADLRIVAEFSAAAEQVPHASCPSSEIMDIYLFDPELLPHSQSRRIEAHTRECPLCGEELNWLKNVEEPGVIEFKKIPGGAKQYLSMAAAIVFFVLSAVLVWQKYNAAPPDAALQSLAVVKEPRQIDFAELKSTSTPLPDDLQQEYDQAVTLFQQSNFQQSARALEKVLSASPDHSATIYLLGNCYYRMNQPEKAFQLCERSERIEPKSYERCMSLVHIALKTGHYERALIEISALYHEASDVPEVRDLYFKITALTRGREFKL